MTKTKSSGVPELRRLKLKWTGVRPLIMHSARGVDPENTQVRQKQQLQRKRTKSEDDLLALKRLDWELGLYWDPELKLYIPSENIERCIVQGAATIKKTKAVEGAIEVTESNVQITSARGEPYPDDLDALYESGRFQFRHVIRIPPRTGSRVMSIRPMIPTGWQLLFEIEFHTIAQAILEEAILAATLIGLCDWRPKFGRFVSEIV
jgi:hypothetical protein